MAYDIAADVLRGAIDIHVHAGPDIYERKLDCIELVNQAIAKGMAGVLIKDHNTTTGDRAYILNRLFPECNVYGAMACNPPVGGISPAAVETAIGLGCCMIFMPTYSSRNHITKWGPHPALAYAPSSPQAGLSVINETGKLSRETSEVLRLIAEKDVILGTGHLSVEETMILLRSAREANVKRMLVTHASLKLIGMSTGRQMEAVRLGAFIEHSFVAASTFLSESERTPLDEMAYQIREVGHENCVMSTDLGQQKNPSPVTGLETFIKEMLVLGFKEAEVSKMVQENPKALLPG